MREAARETKAKGCREEADVRRGDGDAGREARSEGITESGILGGRQMVREEWRQEGRYALSGQGVGGGKAAEGENQSQGLAMKRSDTGTEVG